MAKLSFKKFSLNFELENPIFGLYIDNHTRHDFSQTTTLTKHLKNAYIKPLYNTLKAKNIVKYARKFEYNRPKNCDVMTMRTKILKTKYTLIEHKDIYFCIYSLFIYILKI